MKRRTCKNNSEHIEEEIIPALEPVYTDKKGNRNTWYKGSSDNSIFIFERTVNGEITYLMFNEIKVDGNVVDPSNYEHSKGSVQVELLPSYLETLTGGSHSLIAIFKDGNDVTISFSILEKKDTDTNEYRAPKTGIQ